NASTRACFVGRRRWCFALQVLSISPDTSAARSSSGRFQTFGNTRMANDPEENDDGKSGKLKERAYRKELAALHVELVKLQEWVKATGVKICICFEGRDAAGKGGVIKAIAERVSPRVFRVIALPVPTEREKSQMYMQRYVQHLPAAGE